MSNLDSQAASEARKRKIEAGKDLDQPSKDDLIVWRGLARKYGVRLPAAYITSEPSNVSKYVLKCGLSRDTLRHYFGDDWRIGDFHKMNPTKGATWFVGNLLEIKNDLESGEYLTRFYE